MEDKLEHNLQLLDFKINEPSPTLLFTNRNYKHGDIPFGERLVLEKAKQFSATAVYFRRTQENQTSLPQIFIYDNTHNTLNNTALIDIHKKIWSSGIVPIYYVVDNTLIRIFDARKPINYQNNQPSIDEIDTLDLVAEAHVQYQKYSVKLFENGTFWEQPKNLDRFLHNNSSSQKLIDGLKKFKNSFVKDEKDTLAHKLLVQAILVKYLEERHDDKGNRVFETDFFAQFGGASDFSEVIRNGQLVPFLESLSEHFNGKIFELSDADKKTLQQKDLSALANFLDAKLDNQQYVLWQLYAFDYLPVELISRIYEEFIPHRSDAVYTPVHLAQFMIDECMPLNTPQENYKLIDVSCGSGIFLVAAFKRMVQWWQKQQYEQTGEIVPPKIELLKSILRESIYGIDIEPDAVRLAVFSLSIALCDMLSPTEIWTNLQFDNLEEKNLQKDNFFRYLSQRNPRDFNLVIGNPPFGGQSKEVEIFIKEYNLKTLCDIPDKQIALLFLQQAMVLLKEHGLLCLVMPAGPLLYNQTIDYRRDFFSRYEIPQIIDFSALSPKGYLFERTVSTAVIFAFNQTPQDEHKILHITVKRSKSAKERHFFEIDHYDLHFVPQDIAIADEIVWKTNLWGGGQLYYLIKRLIDGRSLGDYLKDKKKNSGWVYGEGYKGLDNPTSNYPLLPAPHLTNQPMVETSKFTEEGIIEITIETSKGFKSPREDNKKIFEAPHLLIKEILGSKKFIIEFVETYLVFKNTIIGIHTPWEQENELKYIENFLQNNYSLLKVLLLSFSSRAGISRSLSTVLKKDFMALPFPEDETVLELSKNEEIILQDILNYSIDEYKRGEKSLVNTFKVNKQQLADFGEVLCRNLNSIYESDGKAFHLHDPIDLLSYICLPVIYGQKENLPTPELYHRSLESLMEDREGAVIYRRVLRLYKNDVVYLIKPKTLRYWLKSMALRDAIDVMQDLIRGGY